MVKPTERVTTFAAKMTDEQYTEMAGSLQPLNILFSSFRPMLLERVLHFAAPMLLNCYTPSLRSLACLYP